MRKVVLGILLATSLWLGIFAQGRALAGTVLLDDFEDSSIRVVNPGETDPSSRYLWNQYEGDFYAGPDPGSEQTSTDSAVSGTRSLKITVTGGNIYMQCYTPTTYWNWVRKYALATYATNTYNALQFRVRIPPQMAAATGGHENVQIGTYVNNGSDMGTAGAHFYHFYNFSNENNAWWTVILDSHPTYGLDVPNGGTERGNIPYPNGSSNLTYVDQLTRFYFDGQGNLSSTPANFYFDRFEFFTRPANENIDQVYSLHGVYDPVANKVLVRWARRKDQDTLSYEVRYAFQDINGIGWNAAAAAPNGTIPGNGSGAYNMMQYSTTGISVSGHDVIYVAIKPQNATLFRQIALPISGNAPSSGKPAAPTGLKATGWN